MYVLCVCRRRGVVTGMSGPETRLARRGVGSGGGGGGRMRFGILNSQKAHSQSMTRKVYLRLHKVCLHLHKVSLC